jgi:hypothetical protein
MGLGFLGGRLELGDVFGICHILYIYSSFTTNMAPTTSSTPTLDDWRYKKFFEIATKLKEAIRQLPRFGKVPICMLLLRYNGLEESSIRKILRYIDDMRERRC